MTDADYKIALPAISKALDEGKTGSKYHWDNRATGASGWVVPKQSFSRSGMQCRGAEFYASAGGKTNASAWKLCKTPDGWKVVDD